MSDRIFRWSEWSLGVVVTTSLTTCAEVAIAKFSGGTIFVPSTSNLTSLTFYGAPYNLTDDVSQTLYTYLPIHDLTATAGGGSENANAVVVYVGAGFCYPLPNLCFGCSGIKMVGAFSSGTTGTVDISLKG